MKRKLMDFENYPPRSPKVASSLSIYWVDKEQVEMNLAITGATSGIGKETVKALAPKFREIFLLARNKKKAKKLIEDIGAVAPSSRCHLIYCDLMDLKTVAAAAEQIKIQVDHLDVLINNAGGVSKNRKLTQDGLEASFSLNHLGHFLLTRLLLPLLQARSGARIINVSSEAHKLAKPDFGDLQCENSYNPLRVYANVKLFNILFARSLADRYGEKGICAFALHPGMVRTSFGSGFTGIVKLGMKMIKPLLSSPKKGAKTSVFLATDPEVIQHNGAYYKKLKISKAAKAANSKDLREKLWSASEALTQKWL